MSDSGSLVRDKRWERVWASIGPVPISDSDIETGFYKTLERLVEIRIEVIYNLIRYTSVVRVEKEMIDRFQFDFLGFTLDKLVEDIDDRLSIVES